MAEAAGSQSLANSSIIGSPSSYILKQFDIINHENESIDIKNIVGEFSIIESIYEDFLELNFTILDSINFMENFQLRGQERVRIRVSQVGPGEDKEVSLIFVVTEYPAYSRMTNDYVAGYAIKAVSEHQFTSEFMRLSKAFNGNPVDISKAILKTHLSVDEAKIDTAESDIGTGNISTIIPNQKPLNAIRWLMNYSYDSEFSPMFFYQTLDGSLRFKSLKGMYKQDSYSKYKQYKHDVITPTPDGKFSTETQYRLLRTHIFDMTSELSMSKYYEGSNGAYASVTKTIDAQTKSFTKTPYEYNVDNIAGIKNKNLSESFKLFDENSLKDFKEPVNFYVSSNKLATKLPNVSTASKDSIGKVNSYEQLFESISVVVNIAGDLEVNAGKKLTLDIPKAYKQDDVDQRREVDKKTKASDRDTLFSGDYIAVSVIHMFKETYMCSVKLKKDKADFEL